jgi:hypothetical protein
MTPRLVHNTNTNHLKKDINQDFRNIPIKGRKDLAKYYNSVLPSITQGYDFTKLQSFLEQNNFASKPTISTNETFIYIMILKLQTKHKYLNI